MCSTMVSHGIFSPLRIDIGLNFVAHTYISFADLSIMDDQAFQRTACILYLEDTHRLANITTITNLTTAFRVERR